MQRPAANENKRSFRRSLMDILQTIGLSVAVAAVAGRTLFPSAPAETGNGVFFTLIELSLLPVAAACWALKPSSQQCRMPILCWTLLIALIAASATFASYRFPAAMMAWEWAGAGIVWLFIRQQSARTGLAPFAALAALLVVTQALLGCWQAAVVLPSLRVEVTKLGSTAFKLMREQGYVPGTPAGDRFLDRLNANEPFGSFANPNSLAGFLLFGLPIIAALAMPTRPGVRWQRLLASVLILLLTVALVLTRSRSAWLAAMAAVALYVLPTTGIHAVVRKRARALAAWLAVTAAVMFVGFSTSFLDSKVITESAKSLSYRFEWWQGSWGVICERPWLGVGFGNFGSHYLRYKLPFSSEEIKDPHNFVIELWTCCGLFTMLTYVALLTVSCWDVARSARATAATEESPPLKLDRWWWIGVTAAPLLVIIFQYEWEWIGTGVEGIAGVFLQAFIRPPIIAYLLSLTFIVWAQYAMIQIDLGRLRWAVLAAVAGLHIHWLTASGCSYPGFMLVLWALLGASAISVRGANVSNGSGSVIRCVVLVITTSMIPMAFFKGVALPIRSRDQILARQRKTNGKTDWERLVSLHEAAARAVPLDATAWKLLAGVYAGRMREEPNVEAVKSFRVALAAGQRAIDLEPRRADHHRVLAELYLEAADRHLESGATSHAIAEFGKMVDCYPNSADRVWQYGAALARGGRLIEARTQFARALELDRTPHPDKRLSDRQRNRAKWILDVELPAP